MLPISNVLFWIAAGFLRFANDSIKIFFIFSIDSACKSYLCGGLSGLLNGSALSFPGGISDST